MKSVKNGTSTFSTATLLLGLLFFNFNVVYSQESTPKMESSQPQTIVSSLPNVPKQSDNSLTSTTLALFWTLAFFIVLVCLVKFASPRRFFASSGAFKTVESSFVMRGKVELATVAWRNKLILIARSGDSLVKLSEIESEENEESNVNLKK